MKREASAEWQGNLKNGRGRISTKSGALRNAPYSFAMRFGDEPGTNPEELIGAAHAGCFSMALSAQLERAGFTPGQISTTAVVTVEKVGEGFAVTESALQLTAAIPGIDEASFKRIAEEAKANCPISKLLNTRITLQATLQPAGESATAANG